MKIFKKILALLLLAMTCSFANWTGGTKEPELRTKIDGKVFYLISTPEELAWFAAQVNSGKTEINAKLSKDIVLWDDSLPSNGEATIWQPIGDSLTKSFNGIFDGDNHKIRGLYVRREYKIYETIQSDSICLGFFGSLGAGGIVKNLKFENTYVTVTVTNYNSTSNRINIGGVIGINAGRVENILFKGILKTGGNVGGLVGKNNGHIEDVSFEGRIIGSGNVGGIVGFNTGIVKEAFSSGNIQSSGNIGGIVGYVENGLTIENCENKADIVANNSYFGGIAGYVKSSTSIVNCTNYGTLDGSGSPGGIAGYASSTIIDNCKNEGSFGGAGIVWMGKSVVIRNCVNNGSLGSVGGGVGIASEIDSVSIVDNCINNGVIRNGGVGIAGGKGSIKNCVNNDTIEGSAGIGYAKVIDNCVNNGVVVNKSNRVLLTGSGDCVGSEAYVSGIGMADTIKNSTNNGDVSVSLSAKTLTDGHNCQMDVYAGGISGYSINGVISKNVNKGKVSAYYEFSHKARNNYGSSYTDFRVIYAGGIVGRGHSNGKKIKIKDNYNLANVGAVAVLDGAYLYNNGIWVGGIAGIVVGDSAVVQNVYSVADSISSYISGGAQNNTYKGILLGQINMNKIGNAQINNAFYDSKIKNLSIPIADVGSADTVNVGKLSTVEMQKDEFAWSLNTTAGTQENTGIWSRKDGYPIFADDENLPIYRVSFDDDGASNIYRYIYEYTNNEGRVSVPKNQDPAEGYRFKGWFDVSLSPVTTSTVFTSDATVTAVYEEGSNSSSSSSAKSSSSSVKSSSSSAKLSSSSAKSSSSIAKSSSSSAKSSSSSVKKTDAIIASNFPIFRVSVVGRNVQIANAKIGSKFIAFDMQGRIILTQIVDAANFAVSLPQAGNYIISNDNARKVVQVK